MANQNEILTDAYNLVYSNLKNLTNAQVFELFNELKPEFQERKETVIRYSNLSRAKIIMYNADELFEMI